MTANSPRVVAIGGGCGVTQVLLGLKQYTSALTGIIAVTDTGRSTGKVRTLANIPAPGDIRNALATLAGEDSFFSRLMQHRLHVPNYEPLDGIAMGNLILAAMTQMTGSFTEAVERMHDILDVDIRILPVTTHNTHLCAELVDGTIIERELNVRSQGKPPIKRVFIQSPQAKAYEAGVEALRTADLITIGPGGLFTSVLACLAFNDIARAICQSNAVVVYICNTTIQPGQTDDYTLSDHVGQIVSYLYPEVLDYAIINTTPLPHHVVEAYEEEGLLPLSITDEEQEKIREMGVQPVLGNVSEIPAEKRELWQKQDTIRHDPKTVAKLLFDLWQQHQN
ncbi:MAG: YvcK family protein [Anaerolineae bacterium]|nr:YvcK family protein [Anaerolineae bacterium]